MRFAQLLSLCLSICAALADTDTGVGYCEPGWERVGGKCHLSLPSSAGKVFAAQSDASVQCAELGGELIATDSGRGAVCVKPFSNCAVGWYEGGRACYQLNGKQLSWDESKTTCNQMGGDLIQILDIATQKFISGYLPTFLKQGIPYIWMGIYQADRTKPLAWTSGPIVSSGFTNWARAEPRINLVQRNAGRIQTGSANGTWEIGPPTDLGGYICQLPKGVNPIEPTPDYKFSCPAPWQLFRGNCYRFYIDSLSRIDARDTCRRVSLVTDIIDIRDATEQEFVQRNLNGRNIWLGLYSKPAKWGEWYWNDDQMIATYYNWNDGEPNNAGGQEFCVEAIASSGGRWNDVPCFVRSPFACKRPADINGSPPTRPPTTVTPRWDSQCGTGWFREPISNTCYMINMNTLNWNDALVYCRSQKGDLASITSVSEKTFITSQIQSAIQAGGQALAFWIGFNDRAEEGRWVWSDGSPVPFINWNYGEPNNMNNDEDCAHILSGGNFFWNDDNCLRQFPSVCKKAIVSSTVKPGPTTIPVPNGQVRGCPEEYTGYNNMCYRFYVTRQNWNDAKQQCKNDGGDLVSIENTQEFQFVYELVQKNGIYDIWIGLHDTASALRTMYFQWIDGSPVTFTNWNKGEPNDWANNENCVEQYSVNVKGQWNDVSCTNLLPFVCKRRQVALMTTLPTTRPMGCPVGFDDVYNKNCYRYVVGNTSMTFMAAYTACRSAGGNLVSILSSEEQGHLNLRMTAMNAAQPFWIGLINYYNYYFYWVNGPILGSSSYTNWATGANVKGSYAFMYPSGRSIGTWSTESSSYMLPNYICKRYQEGPTTPQPPPTTYDPKFCAVGWVEADNTCYRGFRSFDPPTWIEARGICKNLGGDLASIHSVNGSEALRSQVVASTSIHYWIGLNSRDSDQSHKWIDGTSPNYFNWRDKEPNNFNKKLNCVLLDPATMQWYVAPCSGTGNYICETPKGINPGNVTTIRPTRAPIDIRCGIDSDWVFFGGSCYIIPYFAQDWFTARQRCRNAGSDLASIMSDDENEFIHLLAARDSRPSKFWIGLNELGQTEGYKWSDGSPVTYLNWKQNEPNNAGGAEHCVNMYGVDGLWSDDQCGYRMYYVCKRNNETRIPDPSPTPMIGQCPSGYFTVGDKCFRLFGKNGDAKTWQEAFDACSAVGGVNRTYLASISSEYEQAYLISLAAEAEVDLWIGLHTRQTSPRLYVWIDNSQVMYTNWDRGEPNGNTQNPENCVEMYSQKYRAGKWNDIRCESKRGYICMTYKQPSILTTWPGPQPTKVLCSAGWMQYGSACFKFYEEGATFADALKQCQAQKSNLASIHDVWEQNYLHSLTSSKPLDDTWIGLSDQQNEGVFAWSDNWPTLYTYWGMNQPSGLYPKGCVKMNRNGKWFNGPCSTSLPYLCRISFGQPPTTPPIVSGRCPSNDFVQYSQFCYFISDGRLVANRKDFASAQLDCKMKGGDLASITSPGEQDFLAQTITAKTQGQFQPTNFWIGMARQLEDGFQWMDGSPANYFHWASGEPSDKDGSAGENCVEMYNSNYQWNDVACAAKNAYVCKVAKRPFTASSGDTSSTTTTTPIQSTTTQTRPTVSSTIPPAVTTSQPVRTTTVQSGRIITDLRNDALIGGMVAFFIILLVAVVVGVFFYRQRFALAKGVETGFANANWSKDNEAVTLDTPRPQSSGNDEAVNPNFSAVIN